jgi:hypothetical protein
MSDGSTVAKGSLVMPLVNGSMNLITNFVIDRLVEDLDAWENIMLMSTSEESFDVNALKQRGIDDIKGKLAAIVRWQYESDNYQTLFVPAVWERIEIMLNVQGSRIQEWALLYGDHEDCPLTPPIDYETLIS